MTQINIAKVYEAGAGKKYGTVQDANGAKYLLPAGLAGVFQAGQTVDVPIKTENWKNRDTGQPEPKQIINGRPGAAGSGAVAQPAPTPPAPPPAAPAPAAAPAGHNSARMSNDDPKDIFIFVTGVVGRAMGSGKYDVTDIDLLTKAALEAYRNNLARAS